MAKKRRKRPPVSVQKKNLRTMGSILVVVVIVAVAAISQKGALQSKIAQGNEKIGLLQAQLEAEENRTKEIEEIKKYMDSDEYIEKIAREKAGLVKENEIIFKEKE